MGSGHIEPHLLCGQTHRQTDTTEKLASGTSLWAVKIHNDNSNSSGINSSFDITKFRLTSSAQSLQYLFTEATTMCETKKLIF